MFLHQSRQTWVTSKYAAGAIQQRLLQNSIGPEPHLGASAKNAQKSAIHCIKRNVQRSECTRMKNHAKNI